MSPSSSSVLVSGGTGFIGRHLVRRLLDEDLDVVCLTRGPSPELSDWGAKVTVIQEDDAGGIATALGGYRCSSVFHLAAAGVAVEDRTPKLLEAGNPHLTRDLMSAVAGWPLRSFVFVGSCAEYAPVKAPHRITEDHPLAPLSPYGAAKVAAERTARDLAEKLGIPLVILRAFGVFGGGEPPNRLIPHIASLLSAGLPAPLTGGEQFRDLSHVSEIVEGMVVAGSLEGGREGAFNLCSGRAVRIREVAERVAQAMGANPALLEFGAFPYRADESMWLVGDPSRMERKTGWAVQLSLDAGISRTLEALGLLRASREQRNDDRY